MQNGFITCFLILVLFVVFVGWGLPIYLGATPEQMQKAETERNVWAFSMIIFGTISLIIGPKILHRLFFD